MLSSQIAALFTVALLGFAGCGSEEPSSESPSATSQTAQQKEELNLPKDADLVIRINPDGSASVASVSKGKVGNFQNISNDQVLGEMNQPMGDAQFPNSRPDLSNLAFTISEVPGQDANLDMAAVTETQESASQFGCIPDAFGRCTRPGSFFGGTSPYYNPSFRPYYTPNAYPRCSYPMYGNYFGTQHRPWYFQPCYNLGGSNYCGSQYFNPVGYNYNNSYYYYYYQYSWLTSGANGGFGSPYGAGVYGSPYYNGGNFNSGSYYNNYGGSFMNNYGYPY